MPANLKTRYMGVLLILVACILGSTTVQGQCRTCTDIVLVIDSSTSIGAENFQTLKNFMIDLANEFDYTSTRVGIYQYGSRAIGRRSLTNNNLLVTRALQNLPYIGGQRSTATALFFARTHLAALGRRTCDRRIFLVTAGTATDSRLIPSRTQLVRRSGFDVIVVGVTNSVSEMELLTLALEKQDNVFTVDDFDSLGTLTTRSRDALIKTCPTCPYQGQLYYDCAPCEGTCTVPKPPCQKTCQPGCACPTGTVLHNGQCIQVRACPPKCFGSASGDPHYSTFDRRRYDLQDRCSHIFAKDCVNDTFAVYSITSNACSRGRAATCIEGAIIDAAGTRLRLFRMNNLVDFAFEGNVPNASDVSVSKRFRGITVNLPKLGVVMQFKRWFLSVCAAGSYRGKLCGLLGDCNGNLRDDFKLMDGTVTRDLIAFETEYRADHITNVCTVDPPQEATCNDPTKRAAAEAFCAPLLDRRGPYAACHRTVNPQTSYDNCVFDHCLCDDDKVECGCTIILEYGSSCRQMGINPGLPPAACLPECPAGQSFKCGPPVPPSCDNPEGTDGVCVEGCFCNDGTILNANGQCVTENRCLACPPNQEFGTYNVPAPTCKNPNPKVQGKARGCVCKDGFVLNEANGRCIPQDRCPRCYGRASGDPHYTTYDRRRYDLQDRCSHVFTKDCMDNTFAVYSITSNACSRGRAPTCIEETLIDAAGSRLRLYRKGASLLHAFEGDVPDTSDVSVAKKFGGITVNLPKLGIVIQFKRWYLSVCAPISYSGKLCGLLGDCNGNRRDDFKLMNGTVTTDLLVFEAEYRADDITKVCTVDPPQEATCGDPTRRAAAEAFCAPLLDRRGPYAACHGTIDPQKSYDNCVFDHCLCDDDKVECGCTIILEYGSSCREMGINPGLPPAACLPSCPAGQSFKCGPPVPPSCDNPDGTDGVCEEGCFCDDGTILNANGECVSEDQCLVCPANEEFGIYDVPQSTCTNLNPEVQGKARGCSCKDGFVLNEDTGNCIPTDQCTRCSIEGQTFQRCAPCNATCDDPNPICPLICRPGCACPVGTVLHEERCIPPSDCPITCPIEGQEYFRCTPCNATCDDPNLACPRICRPGCACPVGTVLHENRCIPPADCPTRCPIQGQQYFQCTPCNATCDDPNPICPLICRPGCACPVGTVIHEERCIPPADCPITCPIEGQQYFQCAPCEATCNLRNPVCPRICRPGCACPVGTVLHERKCISISECPECPLEGQIYHRCAPCEGTCDEPDPPCPRICIPGCACPDGSVLHNNVCIKGDQCPVDCGELNDIDNGEVSLNATTEGSTATYSCDAGYELNGDTTRTCLADGTWSGTEPQCQESRQCQEKVDIVFLVDTSGSVGRSNFIKQQEFLANLVDGLTISPDKVRVSQVTYGSRTYFEFDLSAHTEKEELKNALLGVRYRIFQRTRTGRGIKFVVDNYKGSIGGRDDSIPVLVVVTDGKSQDDVSGPAQQAKDAGFLVLSVGVGKNVAEDELKEIASRDDLVVLASDFDSLHEIVAKITALIVACPVECGEPENLDNGGVDTSNGTQYPATAVYVCNEGYELEGNNKVTCQEDGTWSDRAPNCTTVTCNVPLTPDNAVMEGDFVPGSNNQLVAFGGTVMYSCMEGFVLIGDDERTCQSDETFTGTLPTCIEIPTGTTPPTTKDVTISYDPAQYTVFEAEGKVTLTAKLTGTWTTACNIPVSCPLGTAKPGDDFEPPTGAFRFEPSSTNMATATVDISLVVDNVHENPEFLLCYLVLNGLPGVRPGPPPNLFLININDCPADRPFGHLPRQPTCINPDLPSDAPNVKGCYCPEGTVLDERIDQCIPVEDCGKCYGVAYGDPHYLTFDGMRYDLQDRCSHIFVKDCADNTFTVYSITSNACTGGGVATCIVAAVIEVPSLNAEVRLFEDLTYEFDENEKTPGNLEIIKTGDKIVVAIHKYSVVVEFKKWYLSVCTPLSYSSKLCGLLGDCNGDSTDDFKLMDGTITENLLTFETEYRADIVESCNEPPPQQATCNSVPRRAVATIFCSLLTTVDGPFKDCHQFIEPETYLQNCILDACLCTEGTTCACGVVRQYATECSRFGITVTPPMICNGNCTGGMVWAPNAPLITPTCDNFIGDIAITGPGCKCPPNFVWEVDQCVDRSECTQVVPPLPIDPPAPSPPQPTHFPCSVQGSSHHTTFDGLVHHFQGVCDYILSKDDTTDSFTIFISKAECGEGAVCIEEVYISISEYAEVLKILEDGQIEPADYPANLFFVEMAGTTIIVTIETVGVTVVFNVIEKGLTVWVPGKFFSQLSGICGNFDFNPQDDLTELLPGGGTKPATDVEALLSWAADPCNKGDCTPEIKTPDECPEEIMGEAIEFCTILLKDAEYVKCGTHVDRKVFLNSCVFDYCAHTGEDGTTDLAVPCDSIIRYAAKCTEFGYNNVSIVPEECLPEECDDNLEFQLCGPNKKKTCSDLEGANDFCITGCFCPKGLVEDEGICIVEEECPAVVTWDREVYIVNNGTLPTVCGLLRSKPTGRNVTVNVSFEAGDMADPTVTGEETDDCCCGHEGVGFSCSGSPCTITIPSLTETVCVFLPYSEDWPEEVDAKVETEEPGVTIQPFEDTVFKTDSVEESCMSLDKQVFYFEEGTCDNDPISVVLNRNLDSPETIGEVEVTGATATGGVDFTQGALRPLFQDNKGDVCVAIKEQEDVEGYECFHVNLKPPETGFVGCKTTKAIGIISEGGDIPNNSTDTCYNDPKFDVSQVCVNNDEVFVATFQGEIDSNECSLGYHFIVRWVVQGTVQTGSTQKIYVLPIQGCPYMPFVKGGDYLVAGINNPFFGAGGVTVENNGVILGCQDYGPLLPEIIQACNP